MWGRARKLAKVKWAQNPCTHPRTVGASRLPTRFLARNHNSPQKNTTTDHLPQNTVLHANEVSRWDPRVWPITFPSQTFPPAKGI